MRFLRTNSRRRHRKLGYALLLCRFAGFRLRLVERIRCLVGRLATRDSILYSGYEKSSDDESICAAVGDCAMIVVWDWCAAFKKRRVILITAARVGRI